MRQSYVQDPETHKLIPKEEWLELQARRLGDAPVVVDDIKPFVSPIDGSVIGSNRDLRNHNARHNVVQALEYGTHSEAARKRREDYFEGKVDPRIRQRRREQIHELINHMERTGKK